MSWIDTLKAALGGSLGQAAIEALPGIIERVLPGGLQGLLNQLQSSGYAAQVNSWLGRGPNEPITGEDLRRVMNSEQVRQIAEKLGIPADQVLAVLAKVLPEAVDHHSPDGTLQAPKG
ncbi:YidB family protein [uncultured Methylobacterium sp.]|uniref:YidB family protein n=1 Tax=uncultured Methylobacterium sp. TaxID=157278 RepID=UPI0035C96213